MKSRFLQTGSAFRAAFQTAIEPPGGAPVYPARQGAFLSGIVLLVLTFVAQQPIDIGPVDYWVHSASVEIFSRDLSNPRHTYQVDPAVSDSPTSNEGLRGRHFSPWQFLLAGIKRAAALSPPQAMLVGAILSTLLLVASLAFFGTQLNHLTGQRWFPVAMPVSVLFFLGTGTNWSGNVYFTLLPTVSAYPSTVAVGLSFVGWALVMVLLRDRTATSAVGLVVVSVLILLIHQLQFFFFLLFCFLWLALATRDPRRGASRVSVLLLLAVSLPLCLLWPFFNPFEITLSATRLSPEVFEGPRLFYAPTSISIRFGIALAGIPFAFLTPPAIRRPLVAFIGFTTLMWLAPAFVSLPSAGHRWATPAMLGMQVSLAWTLVWTVEQALSRPPRSRLVMTVAALLGAGFALTGAVQLREAGRRFKDAFPFSMEFARQRDLHRWARFAAALPPQLRETTLIADPQASFAMTGIGLNPMIFSESFRGGRSSPTTRKLARAYDPDSTEETRCRSLRSLGAYPYIVDTVRNHLDVQLQLARLGSLLHSSERIRIYRLNPLLPCSVKANEPE